MTKYKYLLDMTVEGVYGVADDDDEYEVEEDTDFIESELENRLRKYMTAPEAKSDLAYDITIEREELDNE